MRLRIVIVIVLLVVISFITPTDLLARSAIQSDTPRMGLRVLIVPDKFKGTLTAQEAAAAMARGWQGARKDDSIELLPMSDGGDGFGVVLSELLGAETRVTKTVDAAHRTVTAEWWWEPKSATAIIEAARVNGLAQLPAG